MFKKSGKFLRKYHRFVTPVFVIITVLYMFVFPIPILSQIQKIIMLTMAVTGAYMYIQIYYAKYKVKKRKQNKA